MDVYMGRLKARNLTKIIFKIKLLMELPVYNDVNGNFIAQLFLPAAG